MMKDRRDTSKVSCCLKYIFFCLNILLLFLGPMELAFGIWMQNNLSQLTNIELILIWVGTITFIIGFTGCVGALRENTCLLACFELLLVLLFVVEIATGIIFFCIKDWIKHLAITYFQTHITHYRQDPDQKNLIDLIQDWLQCCGVEGPNDWNRNADFNCSSGAREACGVPFSCCRNKPQDIIRGEQCGYDVRKPTYNVNITTIIFDTGCLEAAEEWFYANPLIVFTLVFCTVVAQGLVIWVAHELRTDIKSAQKASGTDNQYRPLPFEPAAGTPTASCPLTPPLNDYKLSITEN